jgi:hypothetical protein
MTKSNDDLLNDNTVARHMSGRILELLKRSYGEQRTELSIKGCAFSALLLIKGDSDMTDAEARKRFDSIIDEIFREPEQDLSIDASALFSE